MTACSSSLLDSAAGSAACLMRQPGHFACVLDSTVSSVITLLYITIVMKDSNRLMKSKQQACSVIIRAAS
jgi:hypothetical protein